MGSRFELLYDRNPRSDRAMAVISVCALPVRCRFRTGAAGADAAVGAMRVVDASCRRALASAVLCVRSNASGRISAASPPVPVAILHPLRLAALRNLFNAVVLPAEAKSAPVGRGADGCLPAGSLLSDPPRVFPRVVSFKQHESKSASSAASAHSRLSLVV